MAGNSCCFKSTSLNIFKNTTTNLWAKCRNKLSQQRPIRQIAEKIDKSQLTEYFRRPFIGDGWSGQVVPKKE